MAIRSLIYKLIFVLIPVVILAASFELVARRIPTSYAIKHINLMRKKDNINVLVMGSSHANFGINPQYMGANAYNLSNTSQDLYYDFNLLKKYLQSCPNIKTVILPISYFTLSSCSLNESVESWRCDFYSTILHIPKPLVYDASMLDLKRFSYLALMDGPMKIIGELRKNATLDINEFGYQKSSKPQNIGDIVSDENGKIRVKFHHSMMDKKHIRANVELIGQIATLLKGKGIKLVFITTPVYETYYKNVLPGNYREMMTNINNLCARYHADYFNHFSDSRFQKEDFMDNDHLNEDGAKKLSLILKNEIINKL